MPKLLFVKGDYLWYADEKKNVYVVRPVEGTTPMFYHCIDLEGKKLLIAQDSLTLYICQATPVKLTLQRYQGSTHLRK